MHHSPFARRSLFTQTHACRLGSSFLVQILVSFVHREWWYTSLTFGGPSCNRPKSLDHPPRFLNLIISVVAFAGTNVSIMNAILCGVWTRFSIRSKASAGRGVMERLLMMRLMIQSWGKTTTRTHCWLSTLRS
ncbi:hypothetical protein BDR03DRAFT_972240 [Suillus americanus]|nr:hypothetical protein BDR03DRAFT_972240 [Suillus americanus]